MSLSEEQKAYLECGVCLELLASPATLPCGHSFCLKCIQTLQRKSPYHAKCPLCRETIFRCQYRVNGALEQLLAALLPDEYSRRKAEHKFHRGPSRLRVLFYTLREMLYRLMLLLGPVMLFLVVTKLLPALSRRGLNELLSRVCSHVSLSYLLQATWATLHLFLRYAEDTSILSNITG
jgi:hypothetical protein